MKNFLIFVFTLATAFVAAQEGNERLQNFTVGSSLPSFKNLRIQGISHHLPKPSQKNDILVFGDSLIEILFEPVEFDDANSESSHPTKSYNLALRSLTNEDMKRLIALFPSTEKFETCVVQIPALHFAKKNRENIFLKVWPGRGLSDYLNLWNPLSRLDHGFDSPANLWTGAISREAIPWDEIRRGGLNLSQSKYLPPLRESLKNPLARARLNQAYGRIMQLSNYKFDQDEVSEFAAKVNQMTGFCSNVVAVWPIFSPELTDPRWGPPSSELGKLRKYLSDHLKIAIKDMPWNTDEIPFLDSQHLDPSFRGEFHKWLAELI